MPAPGPSTFLGSPPPRGQPRVFRTLAPAVPGVQATPTPARFVFLPAGRLYQFAAGGDGVVPYFVKQPSETYPIAFNYAGQIPAGATISSGTVSAVNASTGDDASALVLDSTTATIDDVNVVARVKSGVAGIDYQLNFLVYLSESSVLEDNMVMRVASY